MNIERYFRPGTHELHRVDGPALIACHAGTNKIQVEEWHLFGQPHRSDGPAYINYSLNGTILKQTWYYRNILHNPNGPALIEYDDQGNIKYMQYFKDGKDWSDSTHPSFISYNNLGNVVFECWSPFDDEEVKAWLKQNDFKWPFTKEQQILFKLRFG